MATDSDTDIDRGMRQLTDGNLPEDHFAPRLIRRTSQLPPSQAVPESIEEFQRRHFPKWKVLLPAPPQIQASYTEEEMNAGHALLDLWKGQFVSQAPQPGDNPPSIPPPTVFYAAGRPLLPERRKFEGMSKFFHLMQ